MRCPKCGTDYSSEMCPECGYRYIKENDLYSNSVDLNSDTFRKHSSGNKLIIAIIGLVIIGCICSILMIKDGFLSEFSGTMNTKKDIAEETVDSSLMTLYEFEQLRIGMSKSEVYEIVGSYGDLMSESGSIGKDYYQMYSYEGYGDIGANAILTFYNLELESKTQLGLKGGYSESTKHLEREKINNPQVDISQLTIDYNITKDDFLDRYCIEASYRNNTKYTITYLSIEALVDDNEEAIIDSIDEVLPGQISQKFKTGIEKAVPKSAVKILECTFEIIDDTGAELYVRYNYETKKHDFF